MKKKVNKENLEVARRLREASNSAGFPSIATLSKETKLPASTIQSYWKGLSKPGADRLRFLSEKLGVAPDWLLYGENRNFSAENTEEHKDVIPIPFYNLKASAGYGMIITEETLESKIYNVSKDFIENVLHVSSKKLMIIEVEGNSMEPTIKSGARIFVDRSEYRRLEGIHVLSMDGYMYVKRLVKTPDRVLVISDNNRYPSFEVKNKLIRWGIPNDPEEMGIIGRVLYVLQSPD